MYNIRKFGLLRDSIIVIDQALPPGLSLISWKFIGLGLHGGLVFGLVIFTFLVLNTTGHIQVLPSLVYQKCDVESLNWYWS